jgi:hypothetical protein
MTSSSDPCISYQGIERVASGCPSGKEEKAGSFSPAKRFAPLKVLEEISSMYLH